MTGLADQMHQVDFDEQVDTPRQAVERMLAETEARLVAMRSLRDRVVAASMAARDAAHRKVLDERAGFRDRIAVLVSDRDALVVAVNAFKRRDDSTQTTLDMEPDEDDDLPEAADEPWPDQD